jgi:hypothetical protein
MRDTQLTAGGHRLQQPVMIWPGSSASGIMCRTISIITATG